MNSRMNKLKYQEEIYVSVRKPFIITSKSVIINDFMIGRFEGFGVFCFVFQTD